MQILSPVLERELRVASRRTSTFLTRTTVATIATVVCAWLLVSLQFNRFGNPSQISQPLFATLSGLAGLYCLLAGVRNTADCISSEKREGTLGLLFLTDLKGYDVIFGKMLATSLSSFYALLSIFPVMAIPLLLGGVPPYAFWGMTALLVNTLFLSLSAGVWVSVLGRQEMRAVGWTLLVLLFFTGGIPFLGLVGMDLWMRFGSALPVREVFSHPPPMCMLWPSPVFAYFQILEKTFAGGAAGQFWNSMLTIHASGWFFLLLASIRIPYSWQDRAASVTRMKLREHLTRWTHGSTTARGYFRRTLLDVNAFFWLAARNRFKSWMVWGVLGVTALCWLWGWYEWRSDFTEQFIFVLIALWLHSILKLWIASESAQRVAEDRQSGALELLLSTPLSVRDILRGQWLALRRQFLWPTITVLAFDLFIGLSFSGRDREWLPTWCAGMAMLVADLVTLAWVGFWLGLRTRNASRALAGGIARVLVLPWIVFSVWTSISSILSFQLVFFRWNYFALLGFWVAIGLGLNAMFLFSARRNLLTRFRELATERAEAKTGRWWWPFGKIPKTPPVLANPN